MDIFNPPPPPSPIRDTGKKNIRLIGPFWKLINSPCVCMTPLNSGPLWSDTTGTSLTKKKFTASLLAGANQISTLILVFFKLFFVHLINTWSNSFQIISPFEPQYLLFSSYYYKPSKFWNNRNSLFFLDRFVYCR